MAMMLQCTVWRALSGRNTGWACYVAANGVDGCHARNGDNDCPAPHCSVACNVWLYVRQLVQGFLKNRI
jgi:hypothetical protein